MAMSVISDRRPEEVRPARFDLSIRKLIDIRKPFGDLRSRLAQTDELSPAGAVMAGDHDVLDGVCAGRDHSLHLIKVADPIGPDEPRDRKSTRLNSSHQIISYAVFCLKKKKPV